MSIIIYMLKVSIAITVFYLLYQIIFKRLTFFVFNRFYLLGSQLLSLVIPLLSFTVGHVNQGALPGSLNIDWEQVAAVAWSGQEGDLSGQIIDPLHLMLVVYFGIAIVRFFLVARKYVALQSHYEDSFVIRQDGINWRLDPSVNSPFTIFRTVYIDEESYHQTWSPVKMHEAVHARQLHSIDLLISEIICSFLWFHPLVFLSNRQIRENHEFLADEAARTSRDLLARYLLSFSDVIVRNTVPSIASHFKSSTFKKRIMMLTNKRTSNRKRWFYLFIVPFILILIMAFQQPVENVLPGSTGPGIFTSGSGQIPFPEGPEAIPSKFPLDPEFQDNVTFHYNKKAINPFTEKLMTHNGIDFGAPEGSSVYAAGDGIIDKAEYHEKYGNLVVISHGKKYVTLYAHLAELNVRTGDHVKLGQQIGTVGSTGLSTGPHLHYEVRKDGENVNPSDYY